MLVTKSGNIAIGDTVYKAIVNGVVCGPAYAENVEDKHTLLLIHGNAISDASIYSNPLTNNGVSLSTNQTKFWESSLYFDGATSSIFIPPLILGNSEFTFDCWVYPIIKKPQSIYTHGDTGIAEGTGGSVLAYNDYYLYYANGFWIQGGTVSLNTWQHVALIGEKNAIKLYVNGELIGIKSGAYNFSNVNEIIGANVSSAGKENFNGYIDEIRISDVARWASNFTPPTIPYEV